MASSLARTMGFRPGSTITLMPNLSRVGATGGEGHSDQRIGRGAADPFAEPQAVEPQAFEGVDDRGEAVVVEACSCAEGVTDAHPRVLTHGRDVQLGGPPSTRRRATCRAPEESIVT